MSLICNVNDILMILIYHINDINVINMSFWSDLSVFKVTTVQIKIENIYWMFVNIILLTDIFDFQSNVLALVVMRGPNCSEVHNNSDVT